MKNIVVGIDFSYASKNALVYAIHIAEKYAANLHLVHCIQNYYPESYPYPVLNISYYKSEMESQLKTFYQDTVSALPSPQNSEKNIPIQFSIIEGPIVTELIQFTKSADVLIIGTVNKHTLLKRFIGSIATMLAEEATCPVLLVPEEYSPIRLQKILYASSHESIKSQHLNYILNFATAFTASLHFLHIVEGDTYGGQMNDLIYNTLFQKEEPKVSVDVSSIRSDDVETGLAHYTLTKEIDLLALVHTKKSFFKNLMYKSHTEQTIKKIFNIPILVLKESK